MKCWLLSALILFPLLSTAVSAAQVDRPQISIGGGAEVHSGAAVNVLLRVGVEGVGVHGRSGFSMVIARIQGDLAIASQAEGRRLPFMDIEFIPVTLRSGAGLGGQELEFFPMHFGTQLRLNESAVVRVDVAGISTSYLGPSYVSEHALIFAKIAADALGYKIASHVSDDATFRGLNVAAVSAQVGAAIEANATFKVRVTLGGNADLNLGGNIGRGFAVQSDLAAYAEVSLDIRDFFQLFLRNSLLKAINGGEDTQSDYQLLVGATFIF